MKKKKAEDELIIEDITDTAPDLVVDEGTAPKEKKGKRRSKNKHKKEEANRKRPNLKKQNLYPKMLR